jgi:hypothetical protein
MENSWVGKVDGMEGDRDDKGVGNGDSFSCLSSSLIVSSDE